MVKSSIRYVLNYIALFWAIAWRTMALSVFTAILCGIGLAVLTQIRDLPPSFVEAFAPMIGLPITLLTGAYIVWKQSIRFAKQPVFV